MRTELEGFRVKSDKHAEAQEWLKFLADNQRAFLATLPAEKMLVESVFSTMIGNDLYLCWYSIQGDNPRPVEDSESELDKRHVAYWEDCIDESVPPLKFDHVVNYVPDELTQKMSRLYEN